jgi:hypothetical protein
MSASKACRKGIGLVFAIFATFALVSSSGVSAYAQLTTGTINGTVTDASGAAVPGATITTRNTETGVARDTVSGPTGRYEVPNLPSGTYEVTATMAGFQTINRTGIELTVGRNAVVDLALQVGNVTEQVTVTGEASRVETTTATVTQLVTERQVEDLPLNNRDLTQLTYLQPGVIRSPAGHGVFGGQGDKITVAGSRGTQNLYLLDGVSNTDISNNPQGASGAYIGAETVREFQIVTNNYSAEYQSAAGGIVSAVTKSGTNDLHGSLFWTLRNDNLDVPRWEDNAFNGGEQGEFKRNQFGGSLGGPIVKDHTFFFGSYEGLRERQSRTQTTTTLTNEARLGIIPGLAPVAVSPLIAPYLSLWPVPGAGNTPLPDEPANPGTIVIAGQQLEPVNQDFVGAKFDHQFGRDQWGYLSGSYNWDDSDRSPFGLLGEVTENGPAGGNGTRTTKHTGSISHIVTLTPSIVNDFKLGYSHSDIFGDVPLGTLDTSALAFHPNRTRVGQINITGGPEAVGFRVDYSEYVQRAYQIREGLSVIRGNHSMRMGFEDKLFRYKQVSCSRGCNGIFTFRSLSDFLTNRPDDFQVFAPGHESPTRRMRQMLFGTYFQDNWQVMPSLTLNLGLRYEFVTVPDEDEHQISNLVNFFDTAVSAPIQIQQRYPTDRFAGTIEEFFHNPTLKSFSPRVGFAWAPGDKRTSLRGGYGIFYDYPMLFSLRTALQELPPFVETARLRRSRVPTLIAQPFIVNAFGGFITDPANATFNVRYMEFDQKNAYVHRWSMTLQHDFGGDLVGSAGYTGSRGVHLLNQNLSNLCKWEGWPENTRPKRWPVPPAGTTCALGFINPAFGEVRTQSPNANSYFHGLALGVQKRMSRGFQFQASYNFSKSIDQGSGVTSNGEEFAQSQRGIYYWDMYMKRGLSAFDRRNTFTLNYTWEMPGRDWTGWRRAALGGWTMNGILTLMDGSPLSLEETSELQANTIGDDEGLRVSLVPGGDNNPVLGGPDRYYDPSHFVPAPIGTFGDVGRDTLTSPGFASFDFSLLKNFAVTENQSLQLRGEVFNLFNRPNFSAPDTTVFINETLNPEAGRIRTTVGSSRQIQLGLRYTF